MIYLYHLTSSEEVYKKILSDGFKSSQALGYPRPKHPVMALKSEDIFFHPLRQNETVENLPVSSIGETFFIAIAIREGSGLQVNNRLYSFDTEPLQLISLDRYVSQESYPFNGLPECRIKIDEIGVQHIALHGTLKGQTLVGGCTPFVPSAQHLRFKASRSSVATSPMGTFGRSLTGLVNSSPASQDLKKIPSSISGKIAQP